MGEAAESPDPHVMPWDALLAFDGRHDPDCLMGKRYLGRTGALVIVAPSGIGKSVLALQLGACAALGRPFFPLQMSGPLRVLYVQAEDDVGDVAESAQGFVAGYRLTPAELTQLRERLRIVRWNDAAGGKFLVRLRAEHERHPFDLVIVNPLFSFAGCNVSEQRELSPFLRNGLNPILNDIRAACALVHHTNKPTADERKKPTDSDQYSGSGSAELTNWARAYITLQQVKSAGRATYKMSFVKRGRRAGILDANGEPATSVFIQHAEDGLCWLPSDYAPDQDGDGKFHAKFDLPRALRIYDRALSWKKNEARIAEDQGMTTRAVRGYRDALEAVQ
jgi:hypothetical protein